MVGPELRTSLVRSIEALVEEVCYAGVCPTVHVSHGRPLCMMYDHHSRVVDLRASRVLPIER